MNDHRQTSRGSDLIPGWVTTTVILVLLADFTWNIFVVGEKAYPTNAIIGGLIGAIYAGDRLLNRNKGGASNEPPGEKT